MNKIAALPWYHRADWPSLHDAFADRDSIAPDYEKWKARAIAREARWREDGHRVQRIVVRPEPLLAWCQANGCACDHAARRAYADERLAQRLLSAAVAGRAGVAGEAESRDNAP